MSDLLSRAQEIATFLGLPWDVAISRLSLGFGYQHQRVNEDFRKANPQSDTALLEWYRTTEEYIWELSAYHLDPGFGYLPMCYAIADRLQAEGAQRVLCLGDGIGDLTMICDASGMDAVYHDLAHSRTAAFFAHRADCTITKELSLGWHPHFEMRPFDAIVSFDFMEHVTDVPLWCGTVYDALIPGGLFVAQNAFSCGSGPSGSIPMHLDRNDKYAHASPETHGLALWDHLLFGLGFKQLSSNWYRKPT